MDKPLIERLEARFGGQSDDRHPYNRDGPEAAAAIRELVDAGERLSRELDWVNDQLDLMPDDYAEALVRLRTLLAKHAPTPNAQGD